MLHRTTIIGGVFGLLAPFIGLFVGLQVSTVLATLLLLPFFVFSALTHTPIGDIDTWVWAFLVLLSGVLWAFVARGIFWFRQSQKKA